MQLNVRYELSITQTNEELTCTWPTTSYSMDVATLLLTDRAVHVGTWSSLAAFDEVELVGTLDQG